MISLRFTYSRTSLISSYCYGGNLQSSQREIKQNDKEGKEDKWQFLHLLLHRDMANYTTKTQTLSSYCDGGNLQSSQREIKKNDKEGGQVAVFPPFSFAPPLELSIVSSHMIRVQTLRLRFERYAYNSPDHCMHAVTYNVQYLHCLYLTTACRIASEVYCSTGYATCTLHFAGCARGDHKKIDWTHARNYFRGFVRTP